MNADPFVSDQSAGNSQRGPHLADGEPVARLSDSRAQLREKLEIDRADADDDTFPRSKAMRMLTGKPGLIIGAVAVGSLFLLRPKLVRHALRALPTQTLWRMLSERLLNRG